MFADDVLLFNPVKIKKKKKLRTSYIEQNGVRTSMKKIRQIIYN